MHPTLPPFVKGMDLCRRFYEQAVRPILAAHFPALRYSAARLDGGSDVLGFDTSQSRDHDWGPKVMLFLDEDEFDEVNEPLSRVLSENLPFTIDGYPTSFGYHVDAYGLEATDQRPFHHGVSLETVRGFFTKHLGVDPDGEIAARQWLAIAQQRLCTVARGKVFHDGLQRLGRARCTLSWYPKDVWTFLLCCQWRRLDQEEPFVARCGDVGDELGSRIVAARQIVELMRLCFLLEKQYWPYQKWFGSAFSGLRCAATLQPIFVEVMESSTWKDRERHLNRAFRQVAQIQNQIGIIEPVEPSISQFYDRPYLVLGSGRFVSALYDAIGSEYLRSIHRQVGSVDQFADSTDILCWNNALDTIANVYELPKE